MDNNNGTTWLGLDSILLIIFVVLKLTGNIEWGWLWVLSPLWIPFALWFVVKFCALVVLGFVAFGQWVHRKRTHGF